MLPRMFPSRFTSRAFPCCNLYRAPRFFSSTPLGRYAAAKKPGLGAPKPGSYKPNPSNPREPRLPRLPTNAFFRQFDTEILKSDSPVVLFKAPSHRSLIFHACTVAAMLWTYATYNSYANNIDPLPGTPPWVQYAFGGVCIISALLGSFVLRRVFGLISSITAMREGSKTNIHIKVKRMIPFAPPREIITTPEELYHSRHVIQATGPHAEEAWRELLARRTYSAPQNFLMSMRYLFTAENMVYVYAKDKGKTKVLRLDTLGQFAKEFRTLETAVFLNSGE